MKQLYLLILILFSTGLSNAQGEQLLGQWTLDSIFDFDILLENPANPISITFSSDTNSLTVDSFCGNTYESFYTPSTSENTIDISQTSWGFAECSEDNQGWEVAIANLLANLDANPKTLSYNITQNGDTTLLELDFSYIYEGIPTSTTGFFTKTTANQPLLGEWFIHYTNLDGNQQYSTISDSNNSINFEETSFNGSVCSNGYGGSYTFNNNNTINITDFAALGGDCSNESETLLFLNPYLFSFFNYFDTNPVYSYTISGSGASETLTLTSGNNDFVVYGRTAQPTDLLGEWYLQYLNSDGVQHDNFIGEVQLNFTNIESEIDDYYIADGGSSCEFHTMSYLPLSNDILRIIDLTSSGSCDFSTVAGIYTSLYKEVITNNYSVESDLNFNIIGSGDNEQLTLQNSSGDFAVYGRTPNNALLTRTWYLSRIEIPGNPTIEIFTIENPSLTLTNDINPITFRTTAFGEGECNAFMSDYEVTLNNGNNIHLLDFSPTLGFCESDYESEYFNIIGFPPNNFSEFEIINNGTTLNVTDLLGARLVFGDEPLSISENEINALQITLKNNPVTTEINLSTSRSGSELNYQIYSIDGKLVKNSILNSESINVDDLNSGLYFIRFFNNSEQTQTIKFIKQ